MPDTRPGSQFKDGVCGACRNFKTRKDVDWDKRGRELDEVLSRFRGNGRDYDCIVAVSGGKDSYRIVKEVTDRGLTPLLVTVTDSLDHTTAGVENLRNLISRFGLNHWQYTINHELFIRATRHAFEKSGEALKFVEYAIYTVPYLLGQKLGIPLVIFGENSAFEYGSSPFNEYDAGRHMKAMIEKMAREVDEYWDGVVEDHEVYMIKPSWTNFPMVMYMSYFIPWSSVDNYEIAKQLGFRDLDGEWDRVGTIENFEQIDSKAYMIHLWLKYPKFGFQRVSDIASRRVREGRLKLEKARKLILDQDPLIDPVALADFCNTLGYTEAEFWDVVHNAPWNKFYGKGKNGG